MSGLPRASSMLGFGLSLFFTLSTASAVDIDPKTQIAVPGDFNGDGRMDALLQPLTAKQPGAIVLRDGTGNLTVLAQQWDAGYLGVDWSAADSTLTAADLNGDGQDDVVLQPRKAGQAGAVLITDPTSQLLNVTQVLPAGYLGFDWSSAANFITAGDFDGDRQKELLLQSTQKGGPAVMVHADATGRLMVVMQQFPDGFLGRHWDAKDETFYVGDFNGDGRQDLLVQSHLAGKGESIYALLLAGPDGRFTSIAETWNTKDLGANWDPTDHKIVITDANHDGVMDIELLSTSGGQNYLFESNAQGQFTQPAEHWTGDKPAPNQPATGTKSGTGGTAISVIPSGGTTPTAKTITAPSNPEQGGTSPRSGGTAPGSGQIMTVNAAGTMAGSGGVSGGTATYSIPIAVPPGIKGMQPSVSLNYSSRGGNGEMGMGWSLSAGSQIHRCPATQAMDGYSSGVTYTSNDRLCLDGQHLVLVSGTYGADGATYRTELDGFSMVTETGNISSGTSSFIVLTKSNHQLRYGYNSNGGGSTNTVFTPSGASAPLAWGLGLEEDQYNNSVMYYYSTFGAGEYLLTSIKYTGNGATPGNRVVNFAYSTRGDISNQYLAGGLTSQTQLLSTVSTQENGNSVSTYNIEYTSSSATGRSMVAGVQECSGSGTGQACLPETTFTWHQTPLAFNAPSAIDENDSTCSDGVTWPGFPYIGTIGDVNGDGYKDVMVSNNCGSTVYLMGPGGAPQGTGITVGGPTSTFLQDTVDIDSDGTADLIGLMPTENAIGYSYYYADPVTQKSAFTTMAALQTTDGANIPYTETYNHVTYTSIVAVKDVDGDGRPDIVVVMPDPNPNRPNYHMLAVYWNVTQPCSTLGCHPTPQFSATPTLIYTWPDQPGQPSPILGANSVGDMDGNGLPDFSMTYYDSSGIQYNYWVFTSNVGGTVSFSFVNQRNDGRTAAGYAATMMDINGDGLPDAVYDCGANNETDLCYALNTGNPATHSLFGPEVDTGEHDWRSPGTDGATEAMQGSVVADIDDDGSQEILYPDTLLDEYCQHDVGSEGLDECIYSTSRTLPANLDHSIYQYSEIKFLWTQLPNGTYGYMPTKSSTLIQAQAQLASGIDLQGDGLTGVVSPFTKGYEDTYFNPQGSYTKPVGLHVASNNRGSSTSLNAAPDMLATSTDGLQHTESWDYYPITSSEQINGLALYRSMDPANNSYVGGSYFYFTSSMYVVGDYVADNGVGSNDTHYFHYGQAIYNSQGRGFQGFRTVVDDDMTSRARTVQVYHQHFPLSGLLQESWTTSQASSNAQGLDLTDPIVDSGAVDHVVNIVGCNVGQGAPWLSPTGYDVDSITCRQNMDAKTYFPFVTQSAETKYDVNSQDLLSTTTATNCTVAAGVCTTGPVYDGYGNLQGSVTVVTDSSGTFSTTVVNTYAVDVTDWWLNKLVEKAATVQAQYLSNPQPSVTRTTDYGYNTFRDVNDVKAEADGDPSHLVETQYGYDVTTEPGNITSVTVSGGSGATSVAPRTTTNTYSTGADAHYFLLTSTDPVGLETTYQMDPRFGSPAIVTPADLVTTTNVYDGFGRLTSTQVGSLPAQVTQYLTYTSGLCDGTTAASTYYVLVNQQDYPGHYTCYDDLNRAIRTGTDSFSSAGELVYQDTAYDTHGRVVQASEPHFSSQPDIWNVNAYDDTNILGRLATHTDAKGVQTAYAYNPDTTKVNGYQNMGDKIVTTTPNDPLNTSYSREDDEVKNSLGKLLTVTNAVGAAEQAATSYGYDSDGNPATIIAADGSTITATYDILGHKLSVTDPDQGTTNYTYDVLGDLKQQIDAKSQMLQMAYDNDSRILTKASPEGATTWCYDGQIYSGGTCSPGGQSAGAIGKLTSVNQSWDNYQENYTYDGMGRVKQDEEVIGGSSYDTNTTYMTDGHVATVTYPESILDAPPVTSAGTTQYAAPNAAVTLAGSATDSDGPQSLDYQWTQTAGPSVTLSNPAITDPSFTTGSALGTTYTFQLTADDGLATDSANVNVIVPSLPSAPATITNDGDTNHDGIFTVSWSAVSVPGTTMTYSLEEAAGNASGPTATWAPVSSCTPSSLSCVVSHAGNGSYYYWYRVRAQDSVNGTVLGYGPYSGTNSINVVVTPNAPSSIGPINGTATGSSEVTWVSGGGKIVFYQLDMTPQGGSTSQIYQGSTSYYVVPAQAQGVYHFKVRACNQSPTSLLTECSAYTGGGEITWSVGGGGGGGGGCPGCQPQVVIGGGGTVVGTPVGGTNAGSSVAEPVNTSSTASPATAPAGGSTAVPASTPAPASGTRSRSVKAKRPPRMAFSGRVRPTYAPPVYKAWADAHLENASGTTVAVRFSVQYLYTANGYLWGLASGVNPTRVYWNVNKNARSGLDLAGSYAENGMDARGNPVDVYAGGTAIHTQYGYDPHSGYLLDVQSGNAANATAYQSLAYSWYAIGNLQQRSAVEPLVDSLGNPTGTYTPLSEQFHYDLHNRLKDSTVTNANGIQPMTTYAYDSVGDITCKSDVTATDCSTTDSGFNYGGNGAGPHALTSTVGTVNGSYSYDADGNMTCRSYTGACSSPNISWNSDNLVTSVTQGGYTSSFSYAPDKHRYMQSATMAGGTETTIYAGGMEQVTDVSGGTQYRITLQAYGRPVMIETLTNDTGVTTLPQGCPVRSNPSGGPVECHFYSLTDHLGSVDTVVSDTGTVSPEESFDSFGKRRDATTWGGSPTSAAVAQARTVTHHGFTHHEHLDNLTAMDANNNTIDGVVDANGRMLDPVVGRFLSVDPVYQEPTNSQSVNPYSYVMNNPLSLVDPSGYNACLAGDLCMSGGENNRDEKGDLLPYVKVVSPDTDVSTLKKGEVVSVNGQLVAALGGGGIAIGNGAILNQQVDQGLNRIAQAADLLGTSSRSSFMNVDVDTAFAAGAHDLDSTFAVLQGVGGKSASQIDAELNNQDTRTMLADNSGPSHPLGYYLPNLQGGVWDALVGFGDGAYKGVTFGIGDLSEIRDVSGIEGSINYDSAAYQYSKVAGEVEGAFASAGAVSAKVDEMELKVWIRRYPNAGGGGIGLDAKGENIIRADWHSFKLNGQKVFRPHLDIPPLGIKHWPWN